MATLGCRFRIRTWPVNALMAGLGAASSAEMVMYWVGLAMYAPDVARRILRLYLCQNEPSNDKHSHFT